MAESIKDWDDVRLKAFIQSEIRSAGQGTSSSTTPSTVMEQFGGLDFPTGTILSWGGSPYASDSDTHPIDPPGWLVCDGRTLKRAEYPGLFQTLSTVYDIAGATVGTDHFVIPDLRGNVLMGQSYFIPGAVPAVGIPPGAQFPAHGGDTTPDWTFITVTFFIKH